MPHIVNGDAFEQILDAVLAGKGVFPRRRNLFPELPLADANFDINLIPGNAATSAVRARAPTDDKFFRRTDGR